MSGYKKCRVEATDNGLRFHVEVKGIFKWKSGFVHTNYFSMGYASKEDALNAIDNYKNRYTKER